MENSYSTYVHLTERTPGIFLSLLTWYPSKQDNSRKQF